MGVPAVAAKTQPASPSDDEEEEESVRELKQEEHQRILGVLPNFNTTSLRNAAKLSSKQKIELAFKSATDPVAFAVAAFDGALSQAENDFPGYHQGWGGYGKRFGAAYADNFDGTMIGNAFLPILFHSDPRYFRKGSGPILSRVLYSVSTTFRAKTDRGQWAPNYANVLGNFVAGGISNLYYPSTDRGLNLTIQRAYTVTLEGSLGALLIEFWPDVSRHFKKHQSKTSSN